jgi:hypothetical protein
VPTHRTLLSLILSFNLPLALAAGQATTASLRGTVTDSIRHGPLVGAIVVASAAPGHDAADAHDYMASTDASGRFAIPSLAPGVYVLTVEHPWLDSTGLGVPSQTVDLARARSATVNLAVPSATTLRSIFCPSTARDSSSGLVAGYVMNALSQHPLAGARVVFAWSDFAVDSRTARSAPVERTAATNTNRDGMFRMCGLPMISPILMQAQFGEHGATGAVEVQIPASGVLLERLRLDSTGTGAALVTGRVRQDGSERAISGAHVHLYGASGEIITTSDGSFRLTDVPLGTQSIEVTAVGYYARRYAVEVRAGDIAPVTIDLSEIGSVLDSVKILAQRADGGGRHSEFDTRRAHGSGQYITEAMIAKANPHETTDLLQQVNGFYVVSDTVYSSRGLTRLQQNADRVCRPTLYLDGRPVSRTMNDISPNDIHGIEIYTSTAIMPPQYPAAPCGAIFIWTK